MQKTTAALIAFFLLLIPISRAAAQQPALIYVNGQDALAAAQGEGWQYDKATNTLTLDDAKLTDLHAYSKEGFAALIYSNGDLNIYLSGETELCGDDSQLCSGIVVDGDLTITAPQSSRLDIRSTPAGSISAEKLKISGGNIIASASDNVICAQTLEITGGMLTGSANGEDMSGINIEEDISVSGTASLVGGAYGDGGSGVYAGKNIIVSGSSSLIGSSQSGCGIMAEGNITVTGSLSRVIGRSNEYGSDMCYGAIVADGDIGGVIDQPDGADVVYFPYPDNKLTHNTVLSGGLPAEAVTLSGVDTVAKTKFPPVMALIFALIVLSLGAVLAIAIYKQAKYESKRWI